MIHVFNVFALLQVMDELFVETFSDFSPEIFCSLRKFLEVIGNVQMIFGQPSDNCGAFVSI